MIVYSKTKNEFIKDVNAHSIADEILEAFQKVVGQNVAISELRAFQNSMKPMGYIMDDSEIPDDVGIAIEYKIPLTSKRVDFIITGADANGADNVIIVELKQWESADLTEKDGIVTTFLGGGKRETQHPSYQAWSYASLINDYNQTVQNEEIIINPCAYLHNYYPDDVIENEFYSQYTDKAPVFVRPDELKLREFIKKYIKKGDQNRLLYRIDNGKLKPSKNLADSLAEMLKNNKEFVLIDEQKSVYETAKQLALKSSEKENEKNVLIVEGGPGTGKSVVAINLLVELTKEHALVTQYVTRNSAPREVYSKKLKGNYTKAFIDNLFHGSGSYHNSEKNSIDAIIVDEAHRLNEKSGMFNHLGENQIKEIISAAKFCVFFIDENQKISLKDIGEIDEIKKWGKALGANITDMKLDSQFRCNGSDGYLSWLDNKLQIASTANETIDGLGYDFRVFDNPNVLFEEIKTLNKVRNKARLVAGYCWNWISKKDSSKFDIVINDFQAQWNLNSHGQSWIIHPESVNQIGCIHTTQGLEVDYVGVIVGPDLLVRNGEVITLAEERASTDKSIFGWKKLMREDPEYAKVQLDMIIKNTYRTLMTRGQKGCYIYSVDPETNAYFNEK